MISLTVMFIFEITAYNNAWKENIMTDIDRIREFIKVQRKYASFFEWYKREKNIKEVGVVESLLESISTQGSHIYKNLRASKEDPPDCLAETGNGAMVGFEVRELVDRDAIELNEKGRGVYRDWTNDEVVQELQKIIDEKDSKNYIGGPYEKMILVIPTDEPVLTYGQLKPVLDIREFKPTKQLHEVYLLFSYDPEIKGYPHIQLRLKGMQTFLKQFS